MTVKKIPEGFHTFTAYLILRNATKAIEFYEKAFGAELKYKLTMPDGLISHGELTIGDSTIMFADENPEWGAKSPQTIGGCPVLMHLYVENADAVVERAVKAGAKLVRPVQDQFYGDRSGGIEDPFGYTWYVATHVEDVSPEEISRRAEKLHGK